MVPITNVFVKAVVGDATSAICRYQPVVRAQRSMLKINSEFQLHIFKRAFVPCRIINEFTAFANTRTLAEIIRTTKY